MKAHFTPVLFLIFWLTAGLANAQMQPSTGDLTNGKSLAKLNVTAIALKTFSVQYEYAIADKITVGLGFRHAPMGKLPLQSIWKKFIDDPELQGHLDQARIGNTAITPEVRFYVGKKGAFHGFYVAPFARLATYKANMPFEYEFEYEYDGLYNNHQETIPLSGHITTITGGVQLGAQWQLYKRLYLDWWILGPQYGASKGKISGQKSLDAEEQAYLRDDLQRTFEDIPLVDTEVSVDENGARVDFSGPWAGVRAGIGLGFRF